MNQCLFFRLDGWTFWKGTIKPPSSHLHTCIKRVCSVEFGDIHQGFIFFVQTVGTRRYQVIFSQSNYHANRQPQGWRRNTGDMTWHNPITTQHGGKIWISVEQVNTWCNIHQMFPFSDTPKCRESPCFPVPSQFDVWYQLNIPYQSDIVDNYPSPANMRALESLLCRRM